MLEREGITCSKGPQGGIEPGNLAARTQPLYMGRPLYRPSYQGAQRPPFLKTHQLCKEGDTKYKQELVMRMSTILLLLLSYRLGDLMASASRFVLTYWRIGRSTNAVVFISCCSSYMSAKVIITSGISDISIPPSYVASRGSYKQY